MKGAVMRVFLTIIIMTEIIHWRKIAHTNVCYELGPLVDHCSNFLSFLRNQLQAANIQTLTQAFGSVRDQLARSLLR